MEKGPMDVALSTDVILEAVMQHLRVRDLLRCRKVCRVWNKQASFVLRKRSTMIRIISREDQLMKLQECMQHSWDFPFSGLKFNYQPWELNSRDAMEFFKTHGHKFTRLCLDTAWNKRLTDMAPFINHLTRLSILEAYCEEEFERKSRAPQGVGEVLELPSVRIFRISTSMVNVDVLDEVLAALSPSVQVECHRFVRPWILIHLKNARRLRAMSSMMLSGDVKLKRDDFLSTELPSLTKLHFSSNRDSSLDLLEALLSSSQKTLKKLHLDSESFSVLSGGSSVFAKLTTLTLFVGGMNYSRGCLFQGEHGDKLPALKELKLRMEGAYHENTWSDGLFIVPSVTKMKLHGYVSQDAMKQLAQAFPNVAEVLIEQDCFGQDEEFVSNPFKMWSVQEFKNLEKLKIWNYIVDRPTSDYINMDSFLTGIPVGICNNLRKHEQVDLTNSPFNEILRENPNILQLKNLRELIVCVKPDGGFERLPEDIPFMSMVSVWYALQMMPNLQTKFVYYDDETPQLSALKAAFEDVKEHIKLEPFFY